MKRSTAIWIVAFGSLLVVAMVALTTWGTSATAQQGYTANAVTVDGQAVSLGTTVTTTNPRPAIAGELTQPGTVTVRLESMTPSSTVVVTGAAGADGKFSVTPTAALALGEYDVYVNDVLAGRFEVRAVPAPPSTGSGVTSDSRLMTWVLSFIAATVVVAGGAAGYARTRPR